MLSAGTTETNREGPWAGEVEGGGGGAGGPLADAPGGDDPADAIVLNFAPRLGTPLLATLSPVAGDISDSQVAPRTTMPSISTESDSHIM